MRKGCLSVKQSCESVSKTSDSNSTFLSCFTTILFNILSLSIQVWRGSPSKWSNGTCCILYDQYHLLPFSSIVFIRNSVILFHHSQSRILKLLESFIFLTCLYHRILPLLPSASKGLLYSYYIQFSSIST